MKKKKEERESHTYVFNCLTKLEKLLCLKYLGKRSLANSGGFQTTKLLLVELQDTIASLDGLSTISYVLLRNGGDALALGMGAGAGVCVAAPLLFPPSMSRIRFTNTE